MAELDRRSHWREAQSMLDLLRLALLPTRPLETLMEHWSDHVRRLREGPRRRQLQTDRLRKHLFHSG